MQIPSFRYDFDSSDIQFLTREIEELLGQKKFLNMGHWCEELEQQFKRLHNSEYALSTNSGTGALELLLAAHDLKGSEVLVPTNTFTATVMPVLRVGAKPVFVDCDQDLGLCPVDLEKKISERSRAIIVVHIGGFISPQIERIQTLCRERGLVLLEDAAHAHGSHYKDKFAGEFGNGAAFSFYSTKVMTTGEGGMLTTSDPKVYERAKLLRHHGQAEDNHVTAEGYNFRMHEFCAIMGVRQLQRLPEYIQKRDRIAKLYDKFFSRHNSVKRLQVHPDSKQNFYKYILGLSPELSANQIQRSLKEKFQISLGGYVYPIPCHEQPALGRYHDGSSLPVAEGLCRQHICLPIFPSMRLEEAEYVAQSLTSILEQQVYKQKIPSRF